MLIMVFGSNKSDELGKLDNDSGSLSTHNCRSSLIVILEGLTVQLEYFSHSVQRCTP